MQHSMIQSIRSMVELPEAQEEKLCAICRPQSLSKGTFFIREGQLPRKFAFVLSGLFRYFYVDDKGNEFTKGFFPEGSFLSSYRAMMQQIPSYLTIEALEDA